eukprot:6172760-Pleurochrysis_carterae.AAC.1
MPTWQASSCACLTPAIANSREFEAGAFTSAAACLRARPSARCAVCMRTRIPARTTAALCAARLCAAAAVSDTCAAARARTWLPTPTSPPPTARPTTRYTRW